MFLTVPTVVNIIWAFIIIFDENKSKTFLDWFGQHGMVALIFTVLSGADIEALSILHSNMAGFEFFNAPFSTKGKNRIFRASCLAIFFKDIPQVIIQILYQQSVVRYDIIPLFALISSCLSLLINIIGRFFQIINICRHIYLDAPVAEQNFTSDELISHSIHVKDKKGKNKLTKISSKVVFKK
ncbi:3350_t:CDS:2 [Diversispora eburnea]|uniref:3350_t:CDS:1 n=1 Tax=Diversispora eburnea TaxID=1213867 RepID=A0A9N9G5T0_9GLOM|nr:3350_t:CDS:2 [Diversispora eburnea]